MKHPATLTLLLALLALDARAEEPPAMRCIEPNTATGAAQAVVVRPTALAHTAQVLPLDAEGRLVGKADAAAQVEKVLDQLAAALAATGSDLERAVKVNVYVRKAQDIPAIQKALARRFAGATKPAMTLVETALPHADALVAMDAVAMVPGAAPAVKRFRSAELPGGCHAAVLPAGPHVYVSGQFSKGDGIADATRQTLEGLRATWKHLGLDAAQVVQVKAFLTPMTAAAEVERAMVKFFGDGAVPPLVFVEWQSDLPIEIELVAAAPMPKEKARDAIEFLTPPGVEPSPVFSRATRINHGDLVCTSGLTGATPGRADAQVKEIFAALGALLAKAGSDNRHLAKATYYVADDAVGRQLTEFRKTHYDPRRPPAASKASVAGVGKAGAVIAVDMIAVVPPRP